MLHWHVYMYMYTTNVCNDLLNKFREMLSIIIHGFNFSVVDIHFEEHCLSATILNIRISVSRPTCNFVNRMRHLRYNCVLPLHIVKNINKELYSWNYFYHIRILTPNETHSCTFIAKLRIIYLQLLLLTTYFLKKLCTVILTVYVYRLILHLHIRTYTKKMLICSPTFLVRRLILI